MLNTIKTHSKMKKRRYPPDIYRNITDDPDTWGMCCSKEAARSCAEAYYDDTERIHSFKDVILAFILSIVMAMMHTMQAGIMMFLPVIIIYGLTGNAYFGFIPVCIIGITMAIRAIIHLHKEFTDSFGDYVSFGQPVGYIIPILVYANQLWH